MIVRKLDIWHLKLPFLSPIKHNLATHEGSDNLVVRVTAGVGLAGYGEGVPRTFVTGEVLASSLAFLQNKLAPVALGRQFRFPRDLLDTLEEWRQDLQATPYPAAFCALEMALLDAASRTWRLPLSDFGDPLLRDRLEYSAVIPMASPERLVHFFHLVKLGGMRFLKLKVGTPQDLSILKLARDLLGPDIDIRVDANSAWTPEEAIARLEEMAPYRLSAVEQPVAKEDFQGMRQVQAAVDFPVIADESLCTLDDARRLIEMDACRIFNIRLSKCGGLGMAARIRQLAAAAGVRCQLGCHVGETSILSAAGRHFGLATPQLAYVEGSFSPYLLLRDPVAQPVVFDHGGFAPPLPGPGLGIDVQESVLHELAVAHHGYLDR